MAIAKKPSDREPPKITPLMDTPEDKGNPTLAKIVKAVAGTRKVHSDSVLGIHTDAEKARVAAVKAAKRRQGK